MNHANCFIALCLLLLLLLLQVLKLTYPFQPVLRDWGKESAAAQRSIISMPAPMFYELHPFHLLMDRQLQLLQWGAAIGRVVPDLRVGQHVRDLFKVSGVQPAGWEGGFRTRGGVGGGSSSCCNEGWALGG
jgi:hypothetical protein